MSTFQLPGVKRGIEDSSSKVIDKTGKIVKRQKKLKKSRESSSEGSSSSSSSSSSDSDSSSDSQSSIFSTESSSSASSSDTEAPAKSKTLEKEPLLPVYEDFMPDKEEKAVPSNISGPSSQSFSEEFDKKIERALQETVEKLTAQLRQRQDSKLEEKKPQTDREEDVNKSTIAGSKVIKKPKSHLKSEVSRLKKEREQLKKKVASLTKLGQAYQSKLGAFFAEFDKKSE